MWQSDNPILRLDSSRLIFSSLCWQSNRQLWHRVLKHHPSLSTLRPKGFSHSKMKWCTIHTNLPAKVIVTLPHPPSGDTNLQETLLAHSADKQTNNYDTICSIHHPSLSTVRAKWLRHSKMNWLVICTSLPVNVIVRLPHPRSGKSRGQETVLTLSEEKPSRNYSSEGSNHHPSLPTLKQRHWGVARWISQGSKTNKLAIYSHLHILSNSKHPTLREEITRVRKCFKHPLLATKATNITQSDKTPIPPYQP